MQFAIQNNDKRLSTQIAKELIERLTALGHQENPKAPDIVITVGGDGTLLSAFHRHAHRLDEVRFIGVHTGHLGFYTDWRDFQIDELIASIEEDKGELVSYPLLDVEVVYHRPDRLNHHFIALNESTIKRVEGTISCDIFIDGEPFERFRGDGICVATPTGSTGYNKSLGGAILHPSIEALQMTEIASINNQVFRTLSSPLITAKDEAIIIHPQKYNTLILTVDHMIVSDEPIDSVKFSLAREKIRFVRHRHLNFWRRVNQSFIGPVSHD